MVTFAELVNSLDNLTSDEMVALKKLVKKKWIDIRQQEILDIAEKARRESANGETIVLSTPEEIKSYFSKMMINED